MKDLAWKINVSKDVLKKTFEKWKKIGIAWTGGKDSTVVLHLVRQVVGGDFNYPVFFIDHGLHFDETLEFVKKLTKEWNLNLITLPLDSNKKLELKGLSFDEQKEKARVFKIECIKEAVENFNLEVLITGIRWDEHRARANEKYFSKREDHIRVHPILHFREKDIWEYIRKFNLPYNPLYDKGYRSIGEKPFTKPVLDPNAPERAGREKEKEEIMDKLRKLGYF